MTVQGSLKVLDCSNSDQFEFSFGIWELKGQQNIIKVNINWCSGEKRKNCNK